MKNRVCIVTGATSGVGMAAARQLAEQGADVRLVARNEDKARQVVEEIRQHSGNRKVDYFIGDFSSLQSIRELAGNINAQLDRIDVLLNNAGVVNQQRQITVDGYEEMFAVNHLGYFLLTNLLLDKVRAGEAPRIVNVASGAHKFSKQGINFDDLHFGDSFSSMKVYGHSKLANILFTRELARRLQEEQAGVTVNCLHPGAVASNFGKNNGALGTVLMNLLKPFFRSIDKGAETAVYLASSGEVAGKTGGYYYDCKEIQPNDWGSDDDLARRLWQVSEELVAN